MYYIGIDLHKQELVMAVENEHGPIARPQRLARAWKTNGPATLILLYSLLSTFSSLLRPVRGGCE